MRKLFCTLALGALLLGGCAGVVERVKPTLDKTYDKAVAVWCLAPAATHLRAINRGSIEARSLTDNCPQWRAMRNALVGPAAPEQ